MAVLGSLLIIGLLGQLTAGRTTVLVPAVGGRYVEALIGYPQQINPLLSRYGTPERALGALIFAGLTQAEADGDVLPDLAWSWEVSSGGQIYTFHLRRDVRWHDGEPFTAQDVLFTIHLLQSPGLDAPPELAAAWRDVDVRAVGLHTVVFSLPQPYAPFLEQTTLGLLPAHLLSGVSPGDLLTHSFNQNPIGTGPFHLKELTSESARLTPHPQYHGPRPYLSTLEFKFYSDAESALSAYSHGEVMGLSRIPASLLEQAAAQPELNLFSVPLNGLTLVMLNTRPENLSDPSVRQALAYALDRQQLIDRNLNGQGIVAHSPIMPGHWAYESNVRRYHQSAARAERLLEEAGWQHVPPSEPEELQDDEIAPPARWEKNGEPLALTLLTDDDPLHRQLAADLSEQWRAIDVAVTVLSLPAQERDALLHTRDFDAALLEIVLPADPDAYPWWHSTQAEAGQNLSGMNDFEIDEALQQARLIDDRAKRWAYYSTFQQVFAEQEPAILLYHPIYTYAVDSEVRNVQIGSLLEPSHRFREIHRWYLVTQRVIVEQ